jgi:hypothetical protein
MVHLLNMHVVVPQDRDLGASYCTVVMEVAALSLFTGHRGDGRGEQKDVAPQPTWREFLAASSRRVHQQR